ncbi:MAG: histidine phosphatase family protein [Bacteroidota bacterium]
MIQIFFVRHGETDYNRKGIVQGSGIDSNLNEHGKRQAQALFEAYNHISFDKVFVSGLKRTHQTIAPWRIHGYDLKVEPALNEFSWGIHEGVVPTVEQRAEFHGLIQKWTEGDLHLSVEKGESPIQAWDRTKNFFDKIFDGPDEATYLMCSHGRQLRIIISNLLKEHMSEMEKYKHDNTAVSIMQFEPKQSGRLIQLNDTKHLKNVVMG